MEGRLIGYYKPQTSFRVYCTVFSSTYDSGIIVEVDHFKQRYQNPVFFSFVVFENKIRYKIITIKKKKKQITCQLIEIGGLNKFRI